MLVSSLRKVAAVLLLIASVSTQAQTTTVRVHDYPGIIGTLLRVAVEKGYCAKYGLECVIQNIPTGALAVQTLLSGGIDIAYPAVEVAVNSQAKGADLKIIGGGFDVNPFMLIVGPELMASTQAGYPEILKLLKGKKVGVTSRGAAPEFQMKSMLIQAGMKPDDVIFVAAGSPNTQYAALVNKQIDASMTFMPLDGFCEVLKTCRVAVNPSRGEGPKVLTDLNGAGGVYVVRREYAQKNAATVEAFTKAMRDAQRFVADPANIPELRKFTEKYFKTDMPNGNEAAHASLMRLRPNLVFDVQKRAIQSAIDYMHSTGQLEKSFDAGQLF